MAVEEAEKVELPEIDPDEAHGISQWEFIDRVPTTDEVVKLLETLPAVWGVQPAAYADFVVGLPQNKKTKVKNEKGVEVTEYRSVVTLYMSVAGRLKMLQEAAEKHRWRVDFEPEPVTPTGAPGYLQMDDRIVYREYCRIWQWRHPNTPLNAEDEYGAGYLGKKPGTAWVPSKGGSQAAGSNPYEKVETSARGRAIAAWGFGVLPGSGVASLEEMQGVGLNKAALDTEAKTPTNQPKRQTRGEILQELFTVAEELRQIRDIDDRAQQERMASYVQKSFGIDIRKVEDDELVGLDWSLVKLDGQLMLTLNQLKQSLAREKSEREKV